MSASARRHRHGERLIRRVIALALQLLALLAAFREGAFTHQHPPPSLLLPFLAPVDAFFLVRSNSSNIEAPSPFFVFGVTSFSVTGEFVRARPSDACDPLTLNATGRVLWVEPYGCPIETKIRNCAAAGCVAAVSSSAYRIPGNEMFTQWDDPTPEISDRAGRTVPFVHLGRKDAELVRHALTERESSAQQKRIAKGMGSSTIGTTDSGTSYLPAALTVSSANQSGLLDVTDFQVFLSSSDSPNQWQAAFSSLLFTLFFQVMLGCMHIIVLLAAVAKFRRYWALQATRPFYARIPLVCLGFLILGNLERGLYCFLDPMGAMHVVPRGYRRIMVSISVPWTYASTLLITFFWSEVIALRSGTKQQHATTKATETDDNNSVTTKAQVELLEPLPAAAAHYGKRSQPTHARVVSPKRYHHVPRTSIGIMAAQFHEPFQLQQQRPEEDDDDIELYVDHHAIEVSGEQEEEKAMPAEFEPMGMVHGHQHHQPRHHRQHRQSPSMDDLNLGELASEVQPSHQQHRSSSPPPSYFSPQQTMKTHLISPLRIVPPPPQSPPPIPAPSSPREQLLPSPKAPANEDDEQAIAVVSPSAVNVFPARSNRYSGLRSEPLYVDVRKASITVTVAASEECSDLVASPSSPQQTVLVHGLHRSSSAADLAVAPPQRLQSPSAASFVPSTPDASATRPSKTTMYDVIRSAIDAHCNPAKCKPSIESDGSHRFLQRYQTPFILSVLAVGLLDLTFSILDSLYLLDWRLLPMVDILFVTIGLVVTSLYFWMSWRVIRRFREEAEWKVRAAEWNAAQGDGLADAPLERPQPMSPAIQPMPNDSPHCTPLQQYVALVGRTPAASPQLAPQAYPSFPVAATSLSPVAKHVSVVISDIHRVNRERIVRLSQFLVSSGCGLLLFLAVSLASPEVWHSRDGAALDDPLTTISRDFLALLGLFIVGACQVTAF